MSRSSARGRPGRFRLPAPAPLLVAVACATAAERAGPADADAEIERMRETFVDAWERGDAASLASIFHEDAIYAANTGQLLRGRAEIEAAAAGWIEERPAGVRLELVTDRLRFRPMGDLAYELNAFEIRVAGTGEPASAGYSLAVWRRADDGPWALESMVVNRIPDEPD